MNNIHTNYRTQDVHFGYNFSNAGKRWHVLSAIRRFKIECNVFETINWNSPTDKEGGLNLLSNIMVSDPNCPLLQQDQQLYDASPQSARFPFTVVGNLVQNCHSVAITQAGASHTLEMNKCIGVLGFEPGQGTYEANYNVAEGNCAEQWNNTLCNGKPIVAEHHSLWDNHILSNSAPHSGETIIVGGVLQIDANVTFTNCTFLMAAGASIHVTNGHTLDLVGSTLQAACDQLWEGITADDPSEQINVVNCTLRNMNSGVQLANGAKTLFLGNTLLDNVVGLQFENTPGGYISSPAGNLGVVRNNRFSSTGMPLLAPMSNYPQSVAGIVAKNCGELEIGELVPGSVNRFDHVMLGIGILPSGHASAIVRVLNVDCRDINLNYNAASYPGEALINSVYTDPGGAGIFVFGGASLSTVNPILHVQNLTGPLSPRFDRCDKAIAGSNISATVMNLNIQDCPVGIALNDAAGETFWIENNRIENAMLGVQLIGDLKTAVVKGNVYHSLQAGYETANRPIWPCGIDVRYTTHLHVAPVLCEGNTLQLNAQAGLGISNTLTGPGLTNKQNTITFTTTETDQTNQDFLHGILSFGAWANQHNCNTVVGTSNPGAYQARPSTGITTYETMFNGYECNTLTNTRAAMLTMGYCATDKLAVKGNVMGNHDWGMLFMPSLINVGGTFGDIGLPSSINNNVFSGQIFNPNGFHLFSVYTGLSQIQYQFFKTPGVQLFSGVQGNGLAYVVNDGPNPFQCQTTSCPDQTGSQELFMASVNTGEALAIAGQTLPFVAFEQVSQYLAERRLFEQLHQDSVSLISNSALNSFYLSQQQDPTGALFRIDSLLVLLTDSLSRMDSSLFLQRLQQVQSVNNSLVTNFNAEINEQWLNALQLKIVRFGRDSVSTSDLQQLEILAKSCPMIEGQAVYKARTIFSFYEPGLFYNDFEDCNLGSKGGANPYQSILTFLKSQTSSLAKIRTDKIEALLLFPNPSSGLLNLKLNTGESGSQFFSIFDVTGRNVLKQHVHFLDGMASVEVYNLPPGLYTYNVANGTATYFGKFLIQMP